MSWLQLAQSISVDVVARLAAANLPALIDGGILFGPQHAARWTEAPRIVMVPLGSRFEAPSQGSRGGRTNKLWPGAGVLYVTRTSPGTGYSTCTATCPAPPLGGLQATFAVTLNAGAVQYITVTNPGSGYMSAPTITFSGDGSGAAGYSALAPDSERLAQISTRAILTDFKAYSVSIHGCVYASGIPAANPDADYDAVEAMYQVFFQSCVGLFSSPQFGVGPLEWARRTKLVTHGRLANFNLTIATPVPDTTLPFVPVGTIGQITTLYQPPGGTPEAP